MRLDKRLLVVVGVAAALTGPENLMADGKGGHRGNHGGKRCTEECAWSTGVHTDRASWVMVFSLDDEGRLFKSTRGRTGEFVTRDVPLSDVFAACNPGCADAFCEWQIVVRSEVPFVAPAGSNRDPLFHVGRRGWKQGDSRRLCRMLGLRPERTRVTVHRVEPRGQRSCRHEWDSFTARVWADVSAGGRVYIDGSYQGQGPAVLLSVAAGPRRLTVVSDSGHKYSGWVSFPLTPYPCGPACDTPARACR